MALIFPAGAKRHDWFNKSASGEKIGVEAMSDEELEALVPGDEDVEIEEVEVEELPGEELEVSEEEQAEGIVDIPGTPEDESLPSKGGTVEERAADLADDAEALVEMALDVADDAKEVADMAIGGEGEEMEEMEEMEEIDEVEDEVEDLEDEVEGEEVAVEEVLESVTPGEPELEKETCNYCGHQMGVGAQASTKKKGGIVVASEDTRMVRFAALSSENRKKLRDYWVNGLGYPSEYVDKMLTDYEK